MPPTPPESAEAIFAAALDLLPTGRQALIAEACGDNMTLFAEVRALLAAHEDAPGNFLSSPVGGGLTGGHLDLDATIDAGDSGKTSGKPAGPVPGARAPAIAPSFSEKAGNQIGRYKLLQEIGEGGFGTVWMAEQTEPVTRRVALKIIKLGMDTKEVIARFEAERQALAMMDHPHIARVFDAGATDKGRPFFVMELVKGMPITHYCDEAGLDTRERLALFADVCSALQHAHQKGIIHRDIKPNNVMVTLHGDKPVVKVIDFGIAKATQGKLTDKTLFTQFEQVIGTPVYMSPEQASLSGLDVDTRSDIYSLGVLLYELLTGRPPFDSKTLVSAGYEEMRRIIREEEPLKPSVRLSTVVGEDRNELAKVRKVAPEKLARLVASDLDWIVMKAIDKDRTRRYETANAFAADISAFLTDEAVSATPPSTIYKLRKFTRRNKTTFRVAAIVLALLLAGIATTTWQAVRATAEAKRATAAEALAAARLVESEAAREDAEATSRFMTYMFTRSQPGAVNGGREIKVVDVLDDAVKTLEMNTEIPPERRAKLQLALGNTYVALGLYQEALELLEKFRDYCLSTYGPEHPETLTAMNNLAASYSDVGRWDEAREMHEEVLALHRKVNGSGHPKSLAAMGNLARAYHKVGRREEALKLNEEVLKLRRKVSGAEDSNTLTSMGNLANSYSAAGRHEESLKLAEEVLELRRKVNGPEHPKTLTAMNGLAFSYFNAGRSEESLKMLEEVRLLCLKVLGPEHPETLRSIAGLANSYANANRYEESLKMNEEVLEMRRKVSGPEHPYTLDVMKNLASIYANAGHRDEALEITEELVELYRKVNGPEHPDTLAATVQFAFQSFYTHGAQPERRQGAIKLLEALPDYPAAVDQLGFFYYDSRPRRTADAIATWSKTVRERPESNYVQCLLGELLFEEKRYEESLKPLQAARKGLPVDHKHYLPCRERLAKSLTALGRKEEAAEVSRELNELTAQMVANQAKEFWGEQSEDPGVVALIESGLKINAFQKQGDGTWSVNLSGVEDFSNLAIFGGRPVSSLNLKGTQVNDLAALRGLALKELILDATQVTDLRPLTGMPLETLSLQKTKVTDLSPLSEMPLRKLNIYGTATTDLTPLRGLALRSLDIGGTGRSDLQDLQGMPLEYLNLRGNPVADLSVLHGMPLIGLRMIGCPQITDLSPLADAKELTTFALPPNAKDIEFLRTFPRLKRLSYSESTEKSWIPAQTAEEFWKEYDAGKIFSSQTNDE